MQCNGRDRRRQRRAIHHDHSKAQVLDQLLVAKVMFLITSAACHHASKTCSSNAAVKSVRP